MPVETIPFVLQETRRGLAQSASATKDQYLGGCVVVKAPNASTQSVNYYLEKRPALADSSQFPISDIGTVVFPSPSLSSPSVATVVVAYGATNSTIFAAGVSGGAITGVCYFVTETIISGVTYWLLSSSDGTGWYLASDSYAVTAYTGDTHTNTVIDNISPSTAGMHVGQAISGTNIAAGTRIASITSGTAITITQATTGTTAGVAITKTPVAKIIDSDFPSMVGGFAVMDGFAFVMTADGKIYNSDLNSIISWSASNFILANLSTDTGLGVIKYRNHIVAFGNQSVEWFYNAGNAFGSILSSRKEYFSQIGMYAEATGSVVTQIDDQVYWVGNDLRLYTFDGFTPIPITQQGMKLGYTVGNSVDGISALKIGFDTIIHVTSFAASSTAFDKWFSIKNNVWTEPNFTVSSLIFADNPIPNTALIGYAVSASDTSGKAYEVSTSDYRDDGSAFTMTIQTEPVYLNDGLPFYIDDIDLISDTQSSGSTLLQSSADDYASFGTIGSFALTAQQKRLPCGGYYDSSVAFKLTDSGNNAWRGQALKVKWRPA